MCVGGVGTACVRPGGNSEPASAWVWSRAHGHSGAWGTRMQQHGGSGPGKSRQGVWASSSGHGGCKGWKSQAGPHLHLECALRLGVPGVLLGVGEKEGRAEGETSGIRSGFLPRGVALTARVLLHPCIPDGASTSPEHRASPCQCRSSHPPCASGNVYLPCWSAASTLFSVC